MSHKRLVWQVYHISRSRYESISQDDNNRHKNNKWCRSIHDTLKELDMEEVWMKNTMTEDEMKNWRYTIKDKIREREERQWRERMQQKPKLRTYQQTQNKTTIRTLLINERHRSETSHHETQRRNE